MLHGILVLALLLLVGCGGGSRTLQMSMPAMPPAVEPTPLPAQPTLDAEAVTRAIVTAGESIRTASVATPNFGSITQSSNVDGTNVTTDTAHTTFDGQSLVVRIDHANSTSTTLNTATDVILSDTGAFPSSLRTGYLHQQRGVGQLANDDLTFALVGTDWDQANPTDYAAFGYWLRVEDVSTSSPEAQIGAFVDASEFRGTPNVPVSGSATYRGGAQGAYAAVVGSAQGIPAGSLAAGEFYADATLRANFDASTISGVIDNIETVESAIDPQGQLLYAGVSDSTDYVLTLAETPIGNGQFVGSTRLHNPSLPIVSQDGKWGGQFSNLPVSATDPDPRGVGGTFGGGFTAGDGSAATYIGVFGAFDKQ